MAFEEQYVATMLIGKFKKKKQKGEEEEEKEEEEKKKKKNVTIFTGGIWEATEP